MTAAGVATSVIVLIMVVASITLLPAFLGLAGHWINRLGIHRPPRHRLATRSAPVGSGGAATSPATPGRTRSVSRVLLLALTAPVLALRLGFPDEGTLPESRTERRAYDLVAEGFGPGHQRPARDRRRHLRGSRPSVEPLLRQRSLPTRGSPRSRPPTSTPTPASRRSSRSRPRRRRTTRRSTPSNGSAPTSSPTVLADSPATAHVGGQTASFADIGDRVSRPAAAGSSPRSSCCRSCC